MINKAENSRGYKTAIFTVLALVLIGSFSSFGLVADAKWSEASEKKVSVCHKTDGSSFKEINISVNALSAHLKHGDKAFSKDSGCGQVLPPPPEEVHATLTVSKNPSSPENGVVIVSETSKTTGVELLRFDVSAANQPVKITSVLVILSPSTSTGFASRMVDLLHLYSGATLIQTKQVPADTNAVSFNDLDINLAQDATNTFTIRADLLPLSETTYSEGDTLRASVPEDGIIAIEADGDAVSAENKTGSAAGSQVSFYTIAPQIVLVSTSILPVVDHPDEAHGTMVFNVTAQGGGLYFSNEALKALQLQLIGNSSDTTDPKKIIAAAMSVSGGRFMGASYRLEQGETATVTATFLVADGLATDTINDQGIYRVGLSRFYWGTSETYPTKDAIEVNAQNFSTAFILLTD